jgi:predicted nucleic acid-binding protein
MPTAIDTSVLIDAERTGNLEGLLPPDETGPFYVPALAAAEFLAGVHPPAPARFRERARRFYETNLRDIVDTFGEAEAAELALLNSELRQLGQTMPIYDTAIAASVRARGDRLLTSDNDFDRVPGLELVKI